MVQTITNILQNKITSPRNLSILLFTFFLFPFIIFAYKIPIDIDTLSTKRDSIHKFNVEKKSSIFYDSLKARAYRNKWMKKLYDLTFDSTRIEKQPEVSFLEKCEKQYRKYEGKIIKHIEIKREKVFTNPDISGSKSIINIKKFLNKYHVITREKTIQNNLLFQQGEKVNPYVFAENEQLLIELPYFQKVNFDIREVAEDSVSVTVITQDAFSLGIGVSFPNLHSSRTRLYNENILGLGQKLETTFLLDTKAEDFCEFVEGMYKVYNIKGSFFSGKIFYDKNDKKEIYDFSFKRDLLPPKVKTTGGVQFGKCKRFPIKSDSVIIKPKSVNSYFNFGFGIPRLLFPKAKWKNSDYISYMASLAQKKFLERPSVSSDSNRFYHDRTIILASVSLFKNNYYKSNLIYNFERIEYIPYGYLVETMVGPDFDEFYNRLYLGLRLAKGDYLKDLDIILERWSWDVFSVNTKKSMKVLLIPKYLIIRN